MIDSAAFVPSFRFFPEDGLARMIHARQAGVRAAVVPADAQPGAVWQRDQCERRRDEIETAGLNPLVIESIATTDEMKVSGPNARRDTDAWITCLENVARAGFKIVTYNWMLVADWLRTESRFVLPDGSTTLAFHPAELPRFTGGASSLPGWGEPISASDLQVRAQKYSSTSESQLWDSLAAFVNRVAPVATELGVKLALHPDDPPWPVLGLPRIVNGEAALERVLQLSQCPAHGLCFCAGSLGVDPNNDLCRMIRRFRERIHYVHLRDVVVTGPQQFFESSHGDGQLNLPQLVRALIEVGFKGPVRPDHGRNIFNENPARPGYGINDRALGLRYLIGLRDGIFTASRQCDE